MEYMLSNAIPSKSKNRSNRAIADNIVEDVYFSVVRSEVQHKVPLARSPIIIPISRCCGATSAPSPTPVPT